MKRLRKFYRDKSRRKTIEPELSHQNISKMIAIIHLMKINQFIKEQSDLLITMLIITKTK